MRQLISASLFCEHGDEGGDELVVVVDAAAVVDAVLPPLLLLLADPCNGSAGNLNLLSRDANYNWSEMVKITNG